MKKGILSLEDFELEPTADDIDAEHIQNVAELNQLKSESDRIDESASIGSAVDSMAGVVEAGVESQEGVSQPVVETIEAAMEHFYVRLGVSKRTLPALESYDTDRLGSSKVALADLRALRGAITAGLVVAQEGFFDRVKNAFERAGTSDEKIIRQVRQLKVQNVGEPRDLGTPAWGRVFARTLKDSIDSHDVYNFLKEYTEVANGEMGDIFNFAANGLQKMSQILARKTFGPAVGAVDEINELADQIAKKCERFGALIPDSSQRSEEYVSITSCDKGNFTRIAAEVEKGAGLGTKLEHEFLRYVDAYWALDNRNESTYQGDNTLGKIISTGMELAKYSSADRRAVYAALDRINSMVYGYIYDLLAIRTKATYSAYKYLQVSAKP